MGDVTPGSERPSSAIYRRLLIGEADVREYTDAVRRESREAIARILERDKRRRWEAKQRG